jgi:hypothetical protein
VKQAHRGRLCGTSQPLLGGEEQLAREADRERREDERIRLAVILQ